MNTTTKYSFAATVLALFLLGAVPAAAETPVDERKAMSPDGRVSIENVQGSVEVQGWSRSEVSVTGTLADNVERLEFEEDDGDVQIKVVLKKNKGGDRRWGWGDRDGDTELSVRVPVAARLSVSGVSADIRVSDFDGEQKLNTVSGDIVAGMGVKDADLQSVSGDVSLRGRGNRYPVEVSVESVSGDVTVTGVAGELYAETVSGDLEIRDAFIERAKVESVSGDIDLAAELAEVPKLKVNTVSGTVRLRFSGTPDAGFEMESFSGRIDSFFGNKAERKSKHGPGRDLRFSLGSGRGDVRVSTLSGNIVNDGDR